MFIAEWEDESWANHVDQLLDAHIAASRHAHTP
jgi:hypothetical protein